MTVNFVLCVWVLSLTYASTAYVASVPAIERNFHIGQEGSSNAFPLVASELSQAAAST